MKKSTESVDTAVKNNSEEESKSRRPSYLTRQLQKLKFGGKSNQVGEAFEETNLSKEITTIVVEKQNEKSTETEIRTDQSGFNDFIDQVL